jgi:hypothetical protein
MCAKPSRLYLSFGIVLCLLLSTAGHLEDLRPERCSNEFPTARGKANS